MNFDISSLSKVGGRENNEDYTRHIQTGQFYCFVVCDGLGGHENGEVASKYITDSIIELFAENPTLDKHLISNYISIANDGLLKLQETREGIKTTLTMGVTDGDNLILAHVGDSRIYCIDESGILYQSEDHSVPMMLFKMGDIKENEIRGHEDSNRILRVMGMEWDRPKEVMQELSIGDKPMGLILCSDGFWEYILEKQMHKTYRRSKSAEQWLLKMEKAVLRKANKKTMDNYTALVVKMNQ